VRLDQLRLLLSTLFHNVHEVWRVGRGGCELTAYTHKWGVTVVHGKVIRATAFMEGNVIETTLARGLVYLSFPIEFVRKNNLKTSQGTATVWSTHKGGALVLGGTRVVVLDSVAHQMVRGMKNEKVARLMLQDYVADKLI
jgi:hypothetical protein